MDKDEKSAISAIRKGDIESLKTYLGQHPGANCLFSNGKTGLYYALESDQDKVCEFLLNMGADPNFKVDGLSTLNWAIRNGRGRSARFLIEHGADVNEADEDGDSPLIHAARFDNQELCKVLVSRGANPMHADLKGKRASEYAANFYGSTAFTYLQKMEKLYMQQDSIPSMRDGPYISWENEGRIVMTYFEHDQEKSLTRLIEKTIEVGAGDTVVQGFEWDEHYYHIQHQYVPDPFETITDGNVFVLGDIHGRYFALLNFLKKNRVVDQEMNWTFGNGHLVLLGDVFDRGIYVTEVLWFLHELGIQAKAAGGSVKLLLGNHEVMEMIGDDRYLSEKYRFFTRYMGVDYYQLYERNTELGRWLRSLNIIVRINDDLFTHAGISPQFAMHDFTFPDINAKVREYLNNDLNIRPGSPEDLILGEIGPQWYRGYRENNMGFPEMTQGFVDQYLDSKGLKRMIVGHNEQLEISPLFNGRVISIDVAIDESGRSEQGLLISGEDLYRCYADGRKELLE